MGVAEEQERRLRKREDGRRKTRELWEEWWQIFIQIFILRRVRDTSRRHQSTWPVLGSHNSVPGALALAVSS